MITPNISVIMPCYNAAATLAEAVASVLYQSVKNFELLIVDDGSTDNSVQVAYALACDDDRIRVIRQRNAGPAEARNRGLAEAEGQVIAFLDADDRWVPHTLAAHLRHFAENAACGVSFGRVRFYDPTMETPGAVSTVPAELSLADVLGEYEICTTSNIVCRRAVYDQVGGFDASLTHGEDQEWVARVLATTSWQVCGLNEVLVYYRTSLGGLSADLKRTRAGWQAMLKAVRGYAPVAVAKAAPQAEALFHRYLARRALRTGQPRASLAPMWHAWCSSPRALLTKAPRRTLMTTLGVIAALVPGNPAAALLAR